MPVLRKGLAAMPTAAPVLVATGAAPAPEVLCCGGGGHYVTWESTRAGTYLEVESAGLDLEVESAGLANGDENASCTMSSAAARLPCVT